MMHEEWFGAASQKALADLYPMVEHLSGTIVEVGCWEGRSTVALANACYPEGVHCVDTWNGSPGEISAVLARRRDVYREFLDNMAELTKHNFYAWRMDWRNYFQLHADPIKLVFIDATHSYQEVADNIRAVLPLMVDGGIICGDDNHHPPVQHAVMDTVGFPNLVATLWWWQAPVGGGREPRRAANPPVVDVASL